MISRHGKMSALGLKRTFAMQNRLSALPPKATAKADIPKMVMSALPPEADMCGATKEVRYGPQADIAINRVPLARLETHLSVAR
jgi:hypothetical protein